MKTKEKVFLVLSPAFVYAYWCYLFSLLYPITPLLIVAGAVLLLIVQGVFCKKAPEMLRTTTLYLYFFSALVPVFFSDAMDNSGAPVLFIIVINAMMMWFLSIFIPEKD